MAVGGCVVTGTMEQASYCTFSRIEWCDMRTFDHVGIPTSEMHADEMYVPETKVWITDPLRHPQRIEYLRFEPDSPVQGPVRELPHIAFRVNAPEDEIEGAEILLGPFRPTETLRIVFVQRDGAVFEFMESSAQGHWFQR